MLRKWKKYGCILFLLIALPYVITIFINGPMRLAPPRQEETEVMQSGEDDRLLTMSLDAYGMGMLAKEISMEMDIETIKAQAVIVRTGDLQKDDRAKRRRRTCFYRSFLYSGRNGKRVEEPYAGIL